MKIQGRDDDDWERVEHCRTHKARRCQISGGTGEYQVGGFRALGRLTSDLSGWVPPSWMEGSCPVVHVSSVMTRGVVSGKSAAVKSSTDTSSTMSQFPDPPQRVTAPSRHHLQLSSPSWVSSRPSWHTTPSPRHPLQWVWLSDHNESGACAHTWYLVTWEESLFGNTKFAGPFMGNFFGREILDPLRGKTRWKKKIPRSIPTSTFITVRIFPIGDSDTTVSHEWDSDTCVTWSRLWENWNFLWFMQPTYITLQVTLSARVSTHSVIFIVSESLFPIRPHRNVMKYTPKADWSEPYRTTVSSWPCQRVHSSILLSPSPYFLSGQEIQWVPAISKP